VFENSDEELADRMNGGAHTSFRNSAPRLSWRLATFRPRAGMTC
jgi:hypothetical protein